MEHFENSLYSSDILDFIRISTEYCKHIEQCQGVERDKFIDTLRSLLPMLYLKASRLEKQETCEGYNEAKVTEDDYNFVRANVAAVMGEYDDYLDVFVEDFKYSDQPVLRTISEDLADIYQVLRNLLEVLRGGYDDAVSVALEETREQFELFLGQTVLNALKAVHDAKFGNKQD